MGACKELIGSQILSQTFRIINSFQCNIETVDETYLTGFHLLIHIISGKFPGICL